MKRKYLMKWISNTLRLLSGESIINICIINMKYYACPKNFTNNVILTPCASTVLNRPMDGFFFDKTERYSILTAIAS